MLAAFGCWFTKNESRATVDQSGTEAAPAAGPALSATMPPAITLTENPYDERFHEGTVISTGLSEMLKRRKIRRNMRRRKEDQQSV